MREKYDLNDRVMLFMSFFYHIGNTGLFMCFVTKIQLLTKIEDDLKMFV